MSSFALHLGAACLAFLVCLPMPSLAMSPSHDPRTPVFNGHITRLDHQHYLTSDNRVCMTCSGNTYFAGTCAEGSDVSDCRLCREGYYQTGSSHLHRRCRRIGTQRKPRLHVCETDCPSGMEKMTCVHGPKPRLICCEVGKEKQNHNHICHHIDEMK